MSKDSAPQSILSSYLLDITLARIVFHMLSTRQAYDETILGRNERQYRARAEARLRAQAKALGYKVVAAIA